MFHVTLRYILSRETQVERLVREVYGSFDPTGINGAWEVSLVVNHDVLNELIAWLQAGRIIGLCVAIVPLDK